MNYIEPLRSGGKRGIEDSNLHSLLAQVARNEKDA